MSEPGGEKARALAEQLANDIVRTVLVNRNVDEECAVGFARDVLRPVLAEALAACALEEHDRICLRCINSKSRPTLAVRCSRGIDLAQAAHAVAMNESAPVGVKKRAAEDKA